MWGAKLISSNDLEQQFTWNRFPKKRSNCKRHATLFYQSNAFSVDKNVGCQHELFCRFFNISACKSA